MTYRAFFVWTGLVSLALSQELIPPPNFVKTDLLVFDAPKIVAAPNTATAPLPAVTQSVPKAVPLVPPVPTIEIPDELKSKASIAAQHVKANQTPEAIVLYSEVLTAKPNLFTISLERGKLYQRGRMNDKAIADFTAAIAARPDYVEAYFRRCVSEYELGKNQEAAADCSKAIELNPNQFEYYYYRGLAYTATRTWEKAASDLTLATERHAENADAHLQLGRVLYEMEQLLGSLREFTVAIQQKPGFKEAYKGRAAVKAALGDTMGSKADLSQSN